MEEEEKEESLNLLFAFCRKGGMRLRGGFPLILPLTLNFPLFVCRHA